MTGTEPEAIPSVTTKQLIVAGGSAQQAVLGSGTQNVYFVTREQRASTTSLAVPLGRRETRSPLRGRDQLVETLVAAASDVGTLDSRAHVIHGLGGCGKTSVALEVAARLMQSGVEAWWVPVVAEDVFHSAMMALGGQLGLSDSQIRRGDLVDLVWDRLAELQRRWLLVFDNADDSTVLEVAGARLADGTGWLRPVDSPNGLVLATSRQGDAAEWGQWCHLHRISSLVPTVAAQVLIDHAGTEAGDTVAAQKLAARLGGLPLALHIAGKSLAEGRNVPEALADSSVLRSFDQYRTAMERGRRPWAVLPAGAEVSDAQARELVERTWDLSLRFLDRRGEQYAHSLLTVLSLLADAPIPYELVLDPTVLVEAPMLNSISGLLVWRSLQALEAVGLIDLAAGTTEERSPAGRARVLQLHPLVRDATRPADGSAEISSYLRTAAASLAHGTTVVGNPGDPARWELWRLLAPHVFHVFDMLGDSEDVAARINASSAASLAARFLGCAGSYAESEMWQHKVLAARQQLLRDDHPDILSTRHDIAWTIGQQGKYVEAERAYRAVLHLRERILGGDHHDTLATRSDIAWLMVNLGRPREGEIEYRNVLTVRQRLLGIDHPDTLSARHSVAWAIGQQGRFKEAEAQYRAVLAIREPLLGADHHDTLTTRHDIAWATLGQGRFREAEAQFQAVLAARERLLGSDHQDTLTTRSNLADVTSSLGHHSEAEAMYLSLLTTQERVLGTDHPATNWTRQQLIRLGGPP
jgi:tetratricopeptide (TPR) repeat protein